MLRGGHVLNVDEIAPNPDERDRMLRQLAGIENSVWMQVADGDRFRPIADEDLDRTNDEKTSAVHFLRFELTGDQVQALKDGAELAAGIDHRNYQVDVRPVAPSIRQSLIKDLD